MAVETHLDELIEYPSTAIALIAESPEVVGFIVNKAASGVTDEDKDIARRHIFDFDYIDETVQQAGSFIMVDADMVNEPSGTIKEMEIYVQIVVSKTDMSLDRKIFKGVKGNRRDNIARQVDLLLRDNRAFGIGPLQLISARTATVPAPFSSKLLTYRVPDFAKNRAALR